MDPNYDFNCFLKSYSNIIIMGCPGAGKSTVGIIVAKMLDMKYIDFDNDVLEQIWGMKVADKVILVCVPDYISFKYHNGAL